MRIVIVLGPPLGHYCSGLSSVRALWVQVQPTAASGWSCPPPHPTPLKYGDKHQSNKSDSPNTLFRSLNPIVRVTCNISSHYTSYAACEEVRHHGPSSSAAGIENKIKNPNETMDEKKNKKLLSTGEAYLFLRMLCNICSNI